MTDAEPTPAPSAPPPETLGVYRVAGVLGGGGMGVVYAAEAPDGSAVAIKALRAGQSSPHEVERFLREATVRVEHPNVIRVLDAGRAAGGEPFLVMERLRGESLDDTLLRGPLPSERVVALGVAACAGLGAVHRAGVVHRDLKPGNLFLCDDGTLKVLDFGVALVEAPSRMTREGVLIGTPSYLSPEQARGARDVDARADVWALGVVLRQALTGRLPFVRESLVATLVAILFDKPDPLDADGVPDELVAILDRCLEKEPSARWESAAALGAALSSLDVAAAAARVRAASRPAPAAALEATTIRHGDIGGARSPPRRASLPTDEQRVVAVLLAQEVVDARALSAIVAEHRGVAFPLLGRALIGVFGIDTWHGDEVERAVAAALAGRRLAARVGVGSGRAMAAGEGAHVSGEAVTSAEAAAKVAIGGVGLARTSLAAVAREVVTRDVPDAPEVVEVTERRPDLVARPSAPPDVPLFGRADALGALLDAWSRAVESSRPVGVVVRGERGIGKTRLRQELVRRVEGAGPRASVLGARASPDRSERALGLLAETIWRDALDAYPDEDVKRAIPLRVADLLEDPAQASACASALGELLGTDLGETAMLAAARADQQLMSDLVRLAAEDYLAATARRHPTLLVLEDAQFADAASLELVSRLGHRCADAPLLVVVLARSTEAGGASSEGAARPELAAFERAFGATVIELGRLRPDDARALAEHVAGRSLEAGRLDAVVDRADGNPLFVEQMVLALRDGGDPASADVPLPVTVEAAIQARLQHLAPVEREAVKRASVLGTDFSLEALEALELDDAAATLAALTARAVLDVVPSRKSNEPRYRFRSRLTLDVAARMLTTEARAHLHRLAAEHHAARRDADAENVARHYDEGGMSAEAARWLVRAALEATARGDSRAVLRFTDRALELGVPDPLAFEVHLARADALRFLGRREEQAKELLAAIPRARTPRDRARAFDAHAAWHLRIGRVGEALAAAEAAARAADEWGDAELRGLAHGRRGEALTMAGRFVDAEAAFAAAQAALDGVRAPRAMAFLAGWRAGHAGMQGDVGGAQRLRREAVEWFERAGDVRSAAANHVNLADALNRLGRYADAEAELRRGLEGCRRVGNRVAEAYGLANLAYALLHQGRGEEALAVLDEVDVAAERGKDARLAGFAQLYRARVFVGAGRAEEARDVALALVESSRRAEMAGLEALAAAVASRAVLALGDVEAALALARRAEAQRDRLGGIEEDEASVFLALAAALAASGDEDGAAETLARGRARLEEVADRIRDPQLRRFFLDLVPHHRAISRLPTR